MTPDVPITTDDAIGLAEAARCIPGSPSPTTVWRWCRHGLRGVRLSYVKAGRRILTSKTAINAFMQRLREADDRISAAPPSSSARPVSASHIAADKRCEDAGW